MPPKGLPGVFASKNWPACGGAPHASDAKNTNLVRARRQVERHALVGDVARRALYNSNIIISRVTEQGQVRGVRLEGDDARTSLTAGAAPYIVECRADVRADVQSEALGTVLCHDIKHLLAVGVAPELLGVQRVVGRLTARFDVALAERVDELQCFSRSDVRRQALGRFGRRGGVEGY